MLRAVTISPASWTNEFMTVFVDNAKIEWRGQNWCHLVADSLEELHAFAKLLGLKREWFQHAASYPHYDITESLRERALLIGAIEGSNARIIKSAKALKAEFEVVKSSAPSQLVLFQ